MSRWPADTPRALNAFYGDPAEGEPGRQLVPVVPPFRMTYEGRPIKSIQFHKKAAEALLAALNDIWDHYGRDQKTIDALGISKFAGSYNPRKIRGSNTRWSNHAYGAAIDLNAEENGLYQKGNMPEPVIEAFERQGARWGGNYSGRKDPMHFEFVDNGKSGPLAFGDLPATDADSDGGHEPEKIGIFRRVRNWVVGGASGVGLGFLGYLTDWQVAAVLAGFTLLFVVLTVAFVIFFFGAENVRAWIRKQVN